MMRATGSGRVDSLLMCHMVGFVITAGGCAVAAGGFAIASCAASHHWIRSLSRR